MKTASPGAATRRFHALSDGTRMAILQRLGRGECCVCDLGEVLGLTQPLLSFHLKVLREAGLVRSRRDGRWAYYRLHPDGIKALQRSLEQLLAPDSRALPVRQEPCCG